MDNYRIYRESSQIKRVCRRKKHREDIPLKGRFFTLKISHTAGLLKALAPRP